MSSDRKDKVGNVEGAAKEKLNQVEEAIGKAKDAIVDKALNAYYSAKKAYEAAEGSAEEKGKSAEYAKDVAADIKENAKKANEEVEDSEQISKEEMKAKVKEALKADSECDTKKCDEKLEPSDTVGTVDEHKKELEIIKNKENKVRESKEPGKTVGENLKEMATTVKNVVVSKTKEISNASAGGGTEGK